MVSGRDRARGAITGFIVGDALGMPTQSLPPDTVRDTYGMITGLGQASAFHPLYPDRARGQATYRSEMMLAWAKFLSSEVTDSPDDMARVIAERFDSESWECLGGSPDLLADYRVDASGGTRMRPVRTGVDPALWSVATGLMYSATTHSAELADTVGRSLPPADRSEQSWQAAVLVAMIISYGIDGAGVQDAVEMALATVAELPVAGQWTAESSVIVRTLEALDWSRDLRRAEREMYLRDVVGISARAIEAVPAALVIAYEYGDEPFRGLCVLAQQGGESATMAAIAGAIFGACHGDTMIEPNTRGVDERLIRDGRGVADRLVDMQGRLSLVEENGMRRD